MINFSVEDDEYPVVPGLIRVQIESFMQYLKPNPEIRGYTVIAISEFNFGGNLPNSVIIANSIPKGVKNW
jgi:hypothetical protein